jgi:hypothetical protein
MRLAGAAVSLILAVGAAEAQPTTRAAAAGPLAIPSRDSLPCPDCARAPRPWVAFGEWQLGMWTAWSFNRFLREGNIGDLSLGFWSRNWRGRWDWDPNSFDINQVGHPLQGATYYNGYRSNGYGFWRAQGMALLGSFVWECCGERNLPSNNDLLTTWLGGASIGEMSRRLSDAVLDNGATGRERFVREAGAFVLNPVRGFDRLVRGHAWRAGRNAPGARPDTYFASISTSAMSMGSARADDRSTRTGTKVALRALYGHPNDVVKSPFSRFEVDLELTSIPGAPISFARTEGSLWGRSAGRHLGSEWLLSATLRYDYARSSAFELGAQSITFGVDRVNQLTPRLRVTSSVRARAVPIAAVEDDFQVVSEEGRNYDYAFGGGLALETVLRYEERALLRSRGLYTAYRVADGVASAHVIERHELIGEYVVSRGAALEGGLRYQGRRTYFDDRPHTKAFSPEYWVGVAVTPPRWRR